METLNARLLGKATAVMAVVAAIFIAPPLGGARADDGTAQPKALGLEVANLTVRSSINNTLSLPSVLSAADVERYTKIFDLQDDGHWKKADKMIAVLENDVLMGHVLEQRYMHPNKYRSKYAELKDWMEEYADHPQSHRIYKLALKRRPSNWKYPAKPDLPKQLVAARSTYKPLPGKKLSKAKRREVRQLRRQIRRHAGFGRTLAAKRMVTSDRVKQLFSAEQYDEMRALLGFRYFIDGRDEWAIKWAGAAAERSGNLVPDAHWAAGLASYRLGRMGEAAKHFEAMTHAEVRSPWLDAAGGFWAARAHMLNHNPERVIDLLQTAARHSRTFYGLLARHVLGDEMDMEWIDLPVEQSAMTTLSSSPRGRRAIALVQIGEHRRAEKELRYEAAAFAVVDPDRATGILALATNAGMPALALRLDTLLFPDGGYDNAAYPVPTWKPDGGFTVDAALVYALIRQESKFNPKAKSWAGASGLMQLMPATASFVARDRAYRSSKRKELLEPVLNMTLGQRYIEILRDDSKINGNLVSMLAAWNGGPGNLNKWRRSMKYQDDPLLFIETIPARETRHFVERVFANLWIYRSRLGQHSPSLEALAMGQWPQYDSVDHNVEQVADNERD